MTAGPRSGYPWAKLDCLSLGYFFIVLAIMQITANVALFGTRLPVNTAIIENGGDALTGVLGIVGVIIGSKSRNLETGICAADTRGLWAQLMRPRFHRIVRLIGDVFFIFGALEVIAGFIFGPRPRSELRLLVDTFSTFVMLLGLLLFYFGTTFADCKIAPCEHAEGVGAHHV